MPPGKPAAFVSSLALVPPVTGSLLGMNLGVLYTFMAKAWLRQRRCPARIWKRRNEMTLCPVALAVGCKKCPAFGVCFLKGVIGDYKKEEPESKPKAGQTKRDVKKPK